MGGGGGGGRCFAYFPMYAHIKKCVKGGGSKMAKMLCTYYMDAPILISERTQLTGGLSISPS